MSDAKVGRIEKMGRQCGLTHAFTLNKSFLFTLGAHTDSVRGSHDFRPNRLVSFGQTIRTP